MKKEDAKKVAAEKYEDPVEKKETQEAVDAMLGHGSCAERKKNLKVDLELMESLMPGTSKKKPHRGPSGGAKP